MPNWKKVITSGSNAALNSLTVTSGITGALTGNASTATAASTVNTGLVTTNATHYIPFVDSNNNPASAESLGTIGTLTYNPNSGVFNANIISGSAAVYSGADVIANSYLKSLNSSGDEGGELFLNKAVTNTTLTGGVTVDVYQNRLRFFEQGGSARGFYLDISSGGAGAGTNLASGGGTVTSVSTTGTVNGITLTGGPITGAGTITLGGSISGVLSGIPSITNPGGAITIGSGMSLTGLTSVTVNPGSTSNPVGLSGSIYLPNIGTATKSNVIYYDTTTKQLTYGATPTGTVTSVATAGTVSGITLTGGTITSSGTITLGGSISGLTTSNLSGTAGITNGQLANSSVTVGTTAISLGSSATTIAGLSSVTSTTFVGALTGTASGNLTSASTLTAGNLSGTIPSGVLGNSSLYVGTTAIALNRGSANLGLTGISSIAFPGSTSGTATLQATATAGTPTLSLPTATGTLVGTGDSGTVTNTMLAGSIANSKLANSTISGIALGSNLNSLTAGSYLTWSSGTTYNGSAASTLAVDATSSNTASKVVARDSSGNFSAGTITAALSGNASTATSASYATAGNTVNITTQNTTPVTYNVTFTGGASGQQSLNVDATTLTYNPSTTTLTTGTVVANLTGNADTATSAGSAAAVSGNPSPNIVYLGGHENLSNTEALQTSLQGELYWNPNVRGVVLQDVGGTNARTIYGQVPASTGEGFIEAQSGRMYYYSNQHIWGDNAYGYSGQFNGDDFDAGGDITCGGTKFFDIPHQTKQGWGLKHAAIEGPESGVYFRGKLSGSDKIELPEYWKWLVHEDTITVTLTPVGQYQALYVKDIKDNEVYIGSDGDFVNCHYVVYGERKDVDRWDVEYENYSRNEK